MSSSQVKHTADNKKAIFVVSSPLQLFNAIEARDRFHENMDVSIFILWKEEIEYVQMSNMLDSRWSKVYIYELNKRFKIFYPWILRSVLKLMVDSSYLYLGYPFKMRAHIANVIKPERVFLLDDGSFSLIFAKKTREATFLEKKSESWYDFLLGRKISLEYIREAYFFTAYPKIDWDKGRLVINDYREYKKKLNDREYNLDVLFIGSPISNELVSKSQEKEMILTMCNYFHGKKILYAVHRFEDIEYLKNEFLNIDFIRFDTAIEVALFQSEIYPQHIASFCSSALVTLFNLNNSSVEALMIPSKFLSNENAEKMNIVYQSYKHSGILLKNIFNNNGG